MFDAVFNQRLQQQRGHRAVGQGRGQRQLKTQPGPHAHGHQFKVVVQAVKLGAQGVGGGPRRLQRGPQVVHQTVKHVGGALGIQRDQRAQVGQRVEQHVRLELALQQLELRLRSLAARGFQLLR